MLSVIVLTKNEEKDVSSCLENLKFCDEILVIDDYSTDLTEQIATRFGAQIVKRELKGDFGSQRNFGLQKAKGDWVLFVDADEVVSKKLQKEISLVISQSFDNKVAYYIKRRDWFWGRELKYGEIKKVRNNGLIRLVKKDSGKWKGKVHEVFTSDGDIGRLGNFLEHYPHQTLKVFLEEVNNYSTLRAKELLINGKSTNIIEIIFFPLGKFLLNYFLYLGFLDGPAGFVYAFLLSFHSFLVRSKLYQYKQT